MRYFIINTKNFVEASGTKLDSFASYISRLSGARIKILLAVPAFDLRYLHSKYPRVSLLVQHLDDARVGPTTGFLLPAFAKIAGAKGSLINHSEHRIDSSSISDLVTAMKELKLISVVCAKDDREVAQFATFQPDFIAVEPPELIGSGNAVSKASPEIIRSSREALNSSGARTRLLCGAGIVDGFDAQRAVELGAEGILVASGVVLSKNWKSKINQLSKGLNDAGQNFSSVE